MDFFNIIYNLFANAIAFITSYIKTLFTTSKTNHLSIYNSCLYLHREDTGNTCMALHCRSNDIQNNKDTFTNTTHTIKLNNNPILSFQSKGYKRIITYTEPGFRGEERIYTPNGDQFDVPCLNALVLSLIAEPM